MYLKEVEWESANGIHLAHDEDQLWAAENTLIKLRFHKMQCVVQKILPS